MSLAGKIGNSLSDFWASKNLDGIDTPVKFREKLDAYSSSCKKGAFNRIPSGVLSQEQVDEFNNNYNEYFVVPGSPGQKTIEEISSQYEECYRLLQQALMVKTENLHIDFIERLRFLSFRIMTAIGIAAVVLGTGYLAQLWEIPIPLLRVSS